MATRENALAIGAPLVKTIIFALIGTFILAVLWVQFGQIRFNAQKTYSAIFTSSSGIQPAATVTASGVDIGRVDKIEVTDQNLAKVTFTVDATVPVAQGSTATIKFKNLTGDQYLDLGPGPGSGQLLAEGGELPVTQTHPALDIDVLLNGFNPLLQGLQPAQVNQLASELVTVLQGQGGTINEVLAHAASFSGSLAQQDQVIGGVINNFNTVLGGIDAHASDLSETVLHAQRLITQLSEARKDFIEHFKQAGEFAGGAGDFVEAINSEPDLVNDLGDTAHKFVDDAKEFDRILGLIPGAYLRLGRVSTNGAGYDFSACGVRLRLTGPDGNPYYTPQIGPSDNNKQCSRDDVAPLQGQRPTDPYGHSAPPSDGQAVAGDANEQGKVKKRDPNPGNPEKGSN